MVAVVALVVLVLWVTGRRERAVRAWAAEVGWTYVGSDRALLRRWRGRPFGLGGGRVRELCVGTFDGRAAMSFAYQRQNGQGEVTATFHVLVVELPAPLSTLELTPGDLPQRLAARLGAQDVDLESAEFNEAWRVATPNERFAHAVLHPRLMERLLLPDALGTSLRLEGSDLLTWSPGAPLYDTVEPRLRLLSDLIDSVPRFVWLDHGYDPGN